MAKDDTWDISYVLDVKNLEKNFGQEIMKDAVRKV